MLVGRQSRWSQKLYILFICVSLLGLTGSATKSFSEHAVNEEAGVSGDSTNTPNCLNNNRADHGPDKRDLLLVSTMDGKVSALNLEKQGLLEWTVDAGALPLLSSSISDLEMLTKNNVRTRLVPSLDGSMFQFDSKNQAIEALPFTADTLLSSSFKLNYDLTIVGGKESATYGVEPRSGKVRYICNTQGCTKFDTDTAVDTNDVIVLTRHTKTVRAVEMRSGIEKWNFSVGQHEVELLETEPEHIPHLTSNSDQQTPPHIEGDEDATIQSCPPDDDITDSDDDWLQFIRASVFAEEGFSMKDIDLKVIVPRGLIIAFNKADPGKVMWKYKFDNAIAKAWLLEEGHLTEVSLFNENVVPALMDDSIEEDKHELAPKPLAYIGTHEGQFYIQPSTHFGNEVQDRMDAAAHGVVTSMPSIRWHPYIATAPSRTPAVSRYNPLQLEYGNEKEEIQQDTPVNNMVVWQDQYPFDAGWYLMSDTSPIHLGQLAGGTTNKTHVYRNLTLTIWDWKGVIAISLLMSIVFHLVIVKFFPRVVHGTHYSTSGSSTTSCEKPVEEVQVASEAEGTLCVPDTPKASPPTQYLSRFASEFEPKQCLGRGGFGVVFEALNMMDDCTYAIKRITVKNSKRARQKVMREVKALARLEHACIVRYYQAWFENPPAGWQEKQDNIVLDMPSTTTSMSSNSAKDKVTDPQRLDTHSTAPNKHQNGSASEVKFDSSCKKDKLNTLLDGRGDVKNPLRVSAGLDRWNNVTNTISWTGDEKPLPSRSSQGFLPTLNSNDMLDESGSYSVESSNQCNIIDNSLSIDIEFCNSGDSTTNNNSHNMSASGSKRVPFSQYGQQISASVPEEETNNSFNIVFEDSGYGLKGTKEDDDASINHTTPVPCSPIAKSSPHRTAVPDSLPLVPQDTDSVVDPLAPVLYLYIQMQLCREDSLKEWLNRHTLRRDRRELLDIFDQIVSAVDYIHDIHGLMHRDLKPSNIFFSLDGTVKVGDFGLVTTLEDEHHTPASATPQHSPQHTGLVGTHLYMSPEQVAGHTYNHKVDIYSLGLIFLELFYPFATQMERINTMLEARKGNLPQRFVRELPDESAFVESLLNPNPEQRPTTKEIQQNPLLRDFEVARQTVSRVRPRTRTTSSSGSGNSLSSSH